MPSLSSPNLNFSPFRTNPRKPRRRPCLVEAIVKLCKKNKLNEAVSSLENLARRGLRLDSRTLASLLQHCADSRALREGKRVHLHLKLTGLKRPGTFLSNHLINMYAKCGKEVEARKVFDKMSARNLYSWNNMLSGYAKLGMIKPARKLFDKMPEKDVVSWNTMVIAHAQCGYWDEALRFYSEFRQLGIQCNGFSFAGVLTVCVKLKEVGLTRQVHGQILVAGFLSNVVLSSSVLDAYVKCGLMGDARKSFDEMSARDVLAWTTMVSGYAKWGDMKSANELFVEMPEKNPVSWTALISGSCLCACASIASLKHGKQIHAYLLRINFQPNTIVVSALIDMYSKCGSLGIGRKVFDLMGNKLDVVLWNTTISALAQHGCGEEAIQMLDDMVRSGAKPDKITFVVILNACSHSGLVQQGLNFFESMSCDYGIVPSQEHYACLIDLLGRAGCFEEVMDQLEKMPYKPDDRVWNALLGVCRIHGNIELGRKAAERLIELEPQSSAAYVLLSSIYAVLGRWESVQKVRQLMNERQVKKERAISWLEIENKLAGQMEEDASLFIAQRTGSSR
ncbi:Pentatricopeptide repeat-containing protein [Vitis vinifera]|uniref:Pentatricopeptide repeat-containing protein n=1 Tax=Vitis vinifera TaxID=29760 RepID=A0A438IIY8_VITVI|nr:Pentatricopeptide repeat-containing protein [Vitis vinifera]